MGMIRLRGAGIALLGALFVGACGSPDRFDGFGTERPGRYSVGDSFTFDNPTLTWSVVGVEGDRVSWRSDRGDEQVTGHDPLLPALEWKNPTQGGGRRAISDVKGALFPLEVGNRMTFTSEVESWTTTDGAAGDVQSWRYNWSCSISGVETVEVQAGSFETYKVQCGRYKPTELVFYYAPRIGHYVVTRIDDAAGQGTVTRNLISFRRVALGGSDLAPPPPPPPPPPPVVVAEPVAPPPPPEPPVVKLPDPSPPTGTGPRVVLGLFSSRGNAVRAWENTYIKKYGDLLGDLEPDYSQVGRRFQAATERLESVEAARALCRKLKSRGQECVVKNN